MRIFEGILIVVNVLSALLMFSRQPSRVWSAVAALNLVLFLIHGALEGFRYQMVFAYGFVVVLSVCAVAGSGTRLRGFRLPRLLKRSLAVVALLALAASASLAYALPVFRLPRPSGSYAVGIRYLHLVDLKRPEPFLAGSTRPRELMVKLFYPAVSDPSRPFAPYFHNSPELLRLLTAGYSLPGFMFDHLNLVTTSSQDGLRLSDAQARYPVVLFSHGAGTGMETQTAQGEDLASHGYVVVAIDHTYVSAATMFPDRTVTARQATAEFNVVEPAAVITQIMADDASFVIDELDALDQGVLDAMFRGRLDLQHIAAVGHSVGGAVAYNLAINEPRVKAAIDLDGIVFVTPGGPAKEMAPFLMLANDRYHIEAIEQRAGLVTPLGALSADEQAQMIAIYGSRERYDEYYRQARDNMSGLADVVRASGDLFTIRGSDHMKFTDIGLFIGARPLRELIGIGGDTDSARCLRITEAVTLAFLDRHLRGGSDAALDGLPRVYPELRRVALP